jgi:phosphatidate phosphatase APP1
MILIANCFTFGFDSFFSKKTAYFEKKNLIQRLIKECQKLTFFTLFFISICITCSTSHANDPKHNVIDDAWATSKGLRFSGRLTEAHEGPKAQGSKLSTLKRQAKQLLTSGEEGRVKWRVETKTGVLEWQSRADDMGYWELHTNLPLPPLALAPGWHTLHSQPVASTLAQPVAHATHAAGLLVHDPHNTSGLISDIDDTILVTQVLDKAKLLKNSLTIAPESRQAVAGMAQLYRKLMDDLPNPAAAPVFYLSASPKQLSDSLRRFLAQHQFPRGVLQLREISPQPQTRDPLADTQNYKIQRIQAILDAFPGVRFLLIGDDAERDPEVYAHFQQMHPERLHSVWIRRIHPDPNRPRYPQQHDVEDLLRGGALPW